MTALESGTGGAAAIDPRARAVRWLRLSYRTGAAVDALAAMQLLVPRLYAAGLGLPEPPAGHASHAMRLGAALMLGWTGVLLWADRRPLERRGVLGLTVAVVLGLAANEGLAVATGLLPAGPVLAIWALQAGLVALFGASLAAARSAA